METLPCYTYIIIGRNDFFYCGITKDWDKRVWEHNTGKSKSTKRNAPYSLKFLIKFETRKQARNLEVTIKKTGVKKWYNKNVLFGHYDNMVCTHLISGKKR
jgi:putative endonuclease